MIQTLALLCLVAAPAIGYVKPFIAHNYEYYLPTTDKEAASWDWVQMNPRKSPPGLEVLKLWCDPSKLKICTFMDDTGYIAGVQLNLDKEVFTDYLFDWTVQGFATWNATDENGKKKEFWAINQYYVSAEFLKIDQAERIANRGNKHILQDKAIWVSGFNGTLYEIPNNVSYFSSEGSDFTLQQTGFIGPADKVYFYKMSPELECRSDTLLPWFVRILERGFQWRSVELGSIGLYVLVSKDVVNANEEYFEDISDIKVQGLITNGPTCLEKLSNSYSMFDIDLFGIY